MATTTKKNVINLNDYFTTSREKEGVWFEPETTKGTGLQFKIYGRASDENILSADAYEKAKELFDAEKDPVKKANMERDAVVERVVAMISDAKIDGDQEVIIDGKPFEYSKETVRKLIFENIDLRTEIFVAAVSNENFMMKKA